MKYKHTIEIITKDFQDLTQFVERFKDYSTIPSIELELVLSKLRNIYDILLMLKNNQLSELSEVPGIIGGIPDAVAGSATIDSDDKPEKKNKVFEFLEEEKTKKEGPLIIKEKEGTDKSVIQDTVQSIEKKPLDEVKAEQTVEKAPDQKVEEMKEKDIEKVEDPPGLHKGEAGVKIGKTLHHTEPVLGEQFKTNKVLIYEKLGSNIVKSDLSTKLQSNPIKNISGNIGLNDKFYYTRELFNGSSEEFSMTIGMLDNAQNFNDAYNYLIEHFDWDMESEAVQKLLSLIRRKFITGNNG